MGLVLWAAGSKEAPRLLRFQHLCPQLCMTLYTLDILKHRGVKQSLLPQFSSRKLTIQTQILVHTTCTDSRMGILNVPLQNS